MCPKGDDCKHCFVENCSERKEKHVQIINNDYSPKGTPLEYEKNPYDSMNKQNQFLFG